MEGGDFDEDAAINVVGHTPGLLPGRPRRLRDSGDLGDDLRGGVAASHDEDPLPAEPPRRGAVDGPPGAGPGARMKETSFVRIYPGGSMSTITEAQPVGLARLQQIDPIAVLSFALGIVGVAIAAVPLGHLALHRSTSRKDNIARTDSRLIAVFGLIAGYLVLAVVLALAIAAGINYITEAS